MKDIHVSVILTTYNWPEALSLILNALHHQTYKNFEVIVADDGSDDRTKITIERVEQNVMYPIHHVWQQDHGFHASKIRNMAINKSSGDYLIFLDGDCIPRKDFILNHIALREPHWFVRGNRIILSERFSQQVVNHELPIYAWANKNWLPYRLKRDIRRFTPLLSLPDTSFRKSKKNKWYGVKTCNMSVWRTDVEHVDGLDETYIGWGREDSDLAVRLINAGIRRKEGIYSTAVFHLWHEEASRENLANNDYLLKDCIANHRVRAKHGLSVNY